MTRRRGGPVLRSNARRAAVALAATLALGCQQSPAAPAAGQTADLGGAPTGEAVPGLVVWESNRSGAYRIWASDLAGDGVRQLSRDEPGRDHCCARISPDGERVAYLSMPSSPRKYLPDTATGELRLLSAGGGEERTLSTTARHIGAHRGIVWWSPGELAYLEADGTTRKLDLGRGTSDVLLRRPPEESGWIVAPGGRCATTDRVTFSELDPATGRLTLATVLGGCEPTFSADGELGVWAAGAGGPIDVIDLQTRVTRTIVRKGDPRLPEGRRYLYFPSLSADRGLLAYAASGGEHDHFRTDYDVFVVALDPETLELAGPPRAISPHPAVDRFPDVWRLAAPRTARAPATRTIAVEAPATPPPLFVWNHATDSNRRAAGADSEILDPHGETWTDRRGRLALAGGNFAAAESTARRVAAGLTATNNLSLAAFVEPAELAGDRLPIVSLTRSPRHRGFVLQQSRDRIELLLRAGGPGAAEPPIPLATLPDAGAHHVAVTFSPGRFAAYLDGELVDRSVVAGDFYHWRIDELLLGAERGRSARFRGHLSHVGIWNRELAAAEIAELAGAARAHLDAGGAVERLVAVTRLVERSRVPTLEEISPYRRALVLEEHELVRGVVGDPPSRFRVARWAILDGERTAAMRVAPGAETRLELEPYGAQPQLESVVLADTLPASDAPRYLAVGLAPD